MSIQKVLESTKSLSNSEKALLAHCLISSLDEAQDEGVESSWATLAQQRLEELESGKVEGLSWDEIRADIKG